MGGFAKLEGERGDYLFEARHQHHDIMTWTLRYLNRPFASNHVECAHINTMDWLSYLAYLHSTGCLLSSTYRPCSCPFYATTIEEWQDHQRSIPESKNTFSAQATPGVYKLYTSQLLSFHLPPCIQTSKPRTSRTKVHSTMTTFHGTSRFYFHQ